MPVRVEVARSEALAAVTLLTAALGLKIVYAFRMGVDTDEPQHLHVAWAWTQGLVQYRDVFDNHPPLFHLVAAPLVSMLGERPDLLVWMRLTMIPLWVLSLWCIYRIGSLLFSERCALWAAVLGALLPSYFLTFVEFRADDLWTALWLSTLATLFGGSLRSARALAVGCLLGATFAVSLKTALLFGTFVGACALLLALDPEAWSAVAASGARWAGVRWFLAGVLVVPLALIALFGALHGLDEFLQSAIVHNLSATDLWRYRVPRAAMFVVTFPVLLVASRAIRRASPSPSLGRSRAVLFLATSLYFSGINAFWPLLPRQNFLPFYPPFVLLLVALALESRAGARRSRAPLGSAALAGVALLEIGLTLWLVPPWKDGTGYQTGMVADVLRLTHPDEPVMDLKGESLFRLRPAWYALEHVTAARLRRGEIADDLVERLVTTRTYVSVHDSPRFPPRARGFLLENYIPVGHLRVAGRFLAAQAGKSTFGFEVELPGDYTILSPGGAVAGVLDGSPLEGPRFLAAGHHVFQPAAGEPPVPLALLWARAAERGYSPFQREKPL